MIILVKQEDLLSFIKKEIQAWELMGGGPNLDAFEFDPDTVDMTVLDRLGYNENREAWIAGMRIKALFQLMKEIEAAPPPSNIKNL